MDYVILRSKLQAVIVGKLVDEGRIRSGMHLVQLRKHRTDNSAEDVSAQCRKFSPAIRKHTFLARYRIGFTGLFLYFLYVLVRCRLGGHRLFFSNINWYPFALALKFVPGQRIHTFDDGTANVQVRDNSYLSETPSRLPGVRGTIARMLFPKGPAHFTRSRIERHFTIYPGLGNVVSGSRLEVIDFDWGSLIIDEDRALLPPGVGKISLGGVYDELNRRRVEPITAQDVALAIEWADLHISHPRQAIDVPRSAVIVKYPAEAIISHYARSGSGIAVAHYNSSVALSFRNNPQVRLIDLMEVPHSSLHRAVANLDSTH